MCSIERGKASTTCNLNTLHLDRVRAVAILAAHPIPIAVEDLEGVGAISR